MIRGGDEGRGGQYSRPSTGIFFLMTLPYLLTFNFFLFFFFKQSIFFFKKMYVFDFLH